MDSSSRPLDVERQANDVYVISLARHRLIDGLGGRELGQSILEFADEASLKGVVIDFAGVEFVSSAFVGMLVDLHRRLAPRGVGLRLCGMCANVMKVFEVTRPPFVRTDVREP